MPVMSNGCTPDIIMNPHGLPKRMTIGQILEQILGKLCAKRGMFVDGTIFRNMDMDTIIKEMKDSGLDPHGTERLYSGITGAHLNQRVFMGPVYYQRLQKFVAKSIYTIDIGPTDVITRQPLDGKANQGGLRISELQRDVLLAHGAARLFSEKIFENSDNFEVYYCRNCGVPAIVNKVLGIYQCKTCDEDADIFAVYSAWSSKLFLQELNAMQIGCKLSLQAYEFYENE